MTFVLFRAKICINYSAKLLLFWKMRLRKGEFLSFCAEKRLGGDLGEGLEVRGWGLGGFGLGVRG